MEELNDEESRAAPTPSIQRRDNENCFRILLATDNHIGYNEKDPIRGQDSINTFREILELGREHQVDFILLAGDLFHENRPSRACIHQTIALLREFTFGDRPVSIELMSEPMIGATPGFSFPPINYEDSNLNVAIPCFSIHGNHDDPQGTGPEGALCALDILSVAGVINYFGKVQLPAEEPTGTDPSNDGMKLQPVLLRKGTTQLAMYGIGNVKDQRMYNELKAHRVRMYLPEEDEGGDDWFYLMLVHQNRVKHGPQLAIPEGLFDDKVDLVVWGHEHDCRIEPEPVAKKRYYITQPGSSVATSLAHGEAIEKKVAILHIQGKNFQIDPIALKTVRPFKMDEVVLVQEAEDPSNEIDLDKRESITAFLQKRVGLLVKEALAEWKEKHSDDPNPPKMMLPLIRLRVETTGVQDPGNAVRFGQAFAGKIANPKDVIQYYRKKVAKKNDRVAADAPEFSDDDDVLMDGGALNSERGKLKMHELVNNYLQAQTLEVLAENQLEDAVHRYVDKEDPDAIKDFLSETLKVYKQNMKAKGKDRQFDDEETLMAELAREKEKHVNDYAENGPTLATKKSKGKKKDKSPGSDDSMLDDDDNASMMHDSDRSSVAPQTKKRAPAAKKAAPKGKGKGKQALFADSEEDELDEESSSGAELDVVRGKKPAPKKAPATAAKKPAAKKAAAKKTTGETQSQLSFGRPPVRAAAKSTPIEIDISDDSE